MNNSTFPRYRQPELQFTEINTITYQNKHPTNYQFKDPKIQQSSKSRGSFNSKNERAKVSVMTTLREIMG